MPPNTERLKPYLRLLRNPAWVCFGWFGMVAGIGLIETPARFRARAASYEAALDIGREVFTALNRAELAALIVVLVMLRTSGLAPRLWAAAAALALVLLLQSIWLLPELAARSQLIVSGGTPGESSAHLLYGVLEIAKLVLLLVLGFASLRQARR